MDAVWQKKSQGTENLENKGIDWEAILKGSHIHRFHHYTIAPYSFIHLPPTLYNVFLSVFQFSPVSIIPPLLHTHSFIYHPRCIMFFFQYFCFPLSLSFHHCSILVFHSPTISSIINLATESNLNKTLPSPLTITLSRSTSTHYSTTVVLGLSRWPLFLRRGSAAARLLGLWVRIPPGASMPVSCECCVLSGRGLCVGLITRPEESYRLWCVWVWSWNLDNEEALAYWGLLPHAKKK